MTRLTYALLFGGFLLACLSAYILITNAQLLTAARSNLDRADAERAKARRDLIQLTREAGDLRSKVNLARAGTIYLIDAMEASQDFLAQQTVSSRAFCELNSEAAGNRRSQQAQDQPALNEVLPASDPGLADFCGPFRRGAEWRRAANAVAMRRAMAITDSDYVEIATAYEGLLPRARGPVDEARIREGLAYARLRQNRLGEAASIIGPALRLAPDLVVPAITSLKIDCARHLDPAQVRVTFQTLRGNLERRISRLRGTAGRDPNSSGARSLRYAQVELGWLNQDPELYERCDYARLRPDV